MKLRSPAAISIVRAADLAEQRRAELVEAVAVAAEQEAAGALAEEGLLGRAAALAQRLQVDLAAEAAARSPTRPGRRRGRRR